jgi:hypothetical protein
LPITGVVNAQKGILQPQIVAPSLVLEILKGSISAFPKETMAPFIIGKESAHLLYKICDINIYVKSGILGYITSLLLISRGTFKTFKLIPLPVAIGQQQVHLY